VSSAAAAPLHTYIHTYIHACSHRDTPSSSTLTHDLVASRDLVIFIPVHCRRLLFFSSSWKNNLSSAFQASPYERSLEECDKNFSRELSVGDIGMRIALSKLN